MEEGTGLFIFLSFCSCDDSNNHVTFTMKLDTFEKKGETIGQEGRAKKVQSLFLCNKFTLLCRIHLASLITPTV